MKNLKDVFNFSSEGWNFVSHYHEETDYSKPVQWRIERAVYNTYNECTFAHVTGPNAENYLIITPGYPYDPNDNKYMWDQDFERTKACQLKYRQSGWNHLLCETEGGIEGIQSRLRALPVKLQESANPAEEFDEFIAYHQYTNREELADLFKANKKEKARFIRTDIAQSRLYDAEDTYFKFHKHDKILSINEALKLTKEICEDYGAPPIRKIIFIKNPDWQKKGDYQIGTGQMRLKSLNHGGIKGVKKSTLLHELSHHIDCTTIQGGELPAAHHGERFRRIYANMLHHYTDLPFSAIRDIVTGWPSRYMRLTKTDIQRRDFGRTRLYDIPPPEKPKVLHANRELSGTLDIGSYWHSYERQDSRSLKI